MGTAALALRGRGTAPTGHCDRRRRADEDRGMGVLAFSQADIPFATATKRKQITCKIRDSIQTPIEAESSHCVTFSFCGSYQSDVQPAKLAVAETRPTTGGSRQLPVKQTNPELECVGLPCGVREDQSGFNASSMRLRTSRE